MALHLTKTGESTIINHNRQIMSRNLYPKRNSYIKERGTIIMTKIKNTKKGMAKKTLSMSLVVAMLATSNVPVWAAEFSDGTDAAAVASEADTFSTDAEAPVVEDNTADATEAQTTGDAWTVSLKDMPSEVEWSATKNVKVTIKDSADGKEIDYTKTGLKYVWKVDDLAVTKPAQVANTISTPATTSADAGKQYKLYIYDESGDWSYTSASFTVSAKDISNTYSLTVADRVYTGKETAKDATVNSSDVKFDIDYTGDLVNVGKVNVTAKPVDTKLYKGVISKSFNITAAPLTTAGLVKAALNTKEVEYTGKNIELKKADVNVTDANTGADLNALVDKDAKITTSLKNFNDEAVVEVPLTANTAVKNFSGTGKVTTTDKVKVVARNLSNVKVTIKPQAKKADGKAYTQSELASAISFTDANGKELTLGNDITVEGLDKAINYGTYTVTIKPDKNTKNVTGQTTAQFSIFSQDISGATFSDTIKNQEYTGSQITPDVSKLKVTLGGKEVDPADYSIEYGENVKAGKGQIYIVGKRTYEGSKATVEFTINQATVSELKTSDYVIVNKDAKKADEYAKAVGLTVKAKNGATPAKEFTLTEGTDYTVAYTYKTKNEVNNYVVATVTLKNNGNFKAGTTSLSKEVRIASPIIQDSDIKLKKTSYEYTGAVIVPEFDVVVNGKTLKKDVDYVIDNVVDSAKTGTATVYITGKEGSEYDSKVKAKATFEVTPVSAEKTTVTVSGDYTYDGTAKKPAASNIKVTLNGNDVTSQFDVAYGTNINAGDKAGTVTVTPKKDNKNFTAGTSQTGTFKIDQKELKGTLNVYDERGIEIVATQLPTFEYDGTEKTFAKVVFTPADKNVTADDYEIKYVNNVTGGGKNGASLVVIAKGNYKANGTVVDNSTSPATTVTNVAKELNFKIKSKLYFTEKEVTVTDAEYAGPNMLAAPTIVVRDGAKTLKEGTDYDVVLTDKKGNAIKTGVVVDVPEKGEYNWMVIGKGVYKYNYYKPTKNIARGTWKVTKKNVANLDVKVDLNEKGETVLTVMNGNLKVDASNFTVKLSDDKKTATVAATTGNKYYVGSKEVAVGGEVVKVGTPIISSVKVAGNKATVILSGEADGAVGYDYVISTDRDCITNKNYDSISKNQVQTSTTFKYVQQGTYYAYCHAWKRDENGKKVFSDWSSAYPFVVSAITPDAPVITNVKVSGSTIKVTYKAAANATGYDVVLGTYSKKENGETRPYHYGDHKVLNLEEGTVTATFKKVPKGTWVVGMHAFNRTSEDGKKVFSPWSNLKKATVK